MAIMILGQIVKGTGRATTLHTPERVAARSRAARMILVPGTLNIFVKDARAALEDLGEPARIDEPWCRIGPGLAVYPVTLQIGNEVLPAVVTRSENSNSRHVLEVMGAVHFRDYAGCFDGANVLLEPREW